MSSICRKHDTVKQVSISNRNHQWFSSYDKRYIHCTTQFYFTEMFLSTPFSFQIVGNRGTIEINPRETMAKESSIVGVMLGHATEVLIKI